MQRIYTDGLRDLDRRVGDFAQPAKQMNHRSRARIVDLANAIQRDDDGRQQRAREDKPGGTVRVFLAPSEGTDRGAFEAFACADMARITGDPAWQNAEAVKTLTIERHMAAARLGFSELFEPLSKPDKLKDGFRDGTLPAMRLFTHRVLPLVTAQRNGDAFAAMAVLRDGSPLVDKRGIRTGRGGQASGLDAARAGVAAMMTLFKDEPDPSCADVLAVVAEHRLFPIPDQLRPCLPDDNPAAQDMADILAELDPLFDELDLTGVASVIDGDTLEIRGQRIRLHGIDAPESRQVCATAEGQRWRCGQQAALSLADRIGRRKVSCTVRDIDRYGRFIAVCHQDGTDLNAWLVREGWAVAYRRYSRDYIRDETEARSARRNIWSGRFDMPWDWRRAQRGG